MTDPVTTIGADTIVSGNLEGDEDLTVEGRVEGSISLSKTLSIEVGGVVRADIDVRNAIISGVLVGNISAQESVHLTEQGRVIGDIAAPRVILVDGSSFRGNIDMGDFDIEQEVEAAAAKPIAVPSVTRTRNVREEATPAPAKPEPPKAKAEPATPKRAAAPKRTTAPKRTVPVKKKAQKAAPAPKVRAVGKKRAKKK